MNVVDLNIDIGEGFANDIALMRYASSVNIACGSHAGNEETMLKTAIAANQKGLAVGAHPGYPDRENFGRLPLSFDPAELSFIVAEQIGLLNKLCAENGIALHHVKPHGALYNQAAADEQIAQAIIEAVVSVDDKLVVYGLSGSLLIKAAERSGMTTASEAFADRGYTAAGELVKRGTPSALIESAAETAERVADMVKYGLVRTITGEMLAITADTICLHGDTPNAIEFAKTIRERLDLEKIAVTSGRSHAEK